MSAMDPADDAAAEPTDHEQDGVGALLRATGRRPAVPADRARRVEASVRAHWLVEVQRRSRGRRFRTGAVLAVAATVLAAFGVWIWKPTGPSPVATTAARVDRVVASAWSDPAVGTTDHPSALRPGDAIAAGSELVTDEGALLAVRTETGYSVRLAAGTRIRLVSAAVIELDHGAVYLDSRGAHPPAGTGLEIRTPFGSIRDVGTQFEARLQPKSLRLRVREGSILFAGRGSRFDVNSGEEVEVAPDGRTERRALDAFDPAWSWVGAVTPMLELDGKSLREFLDWMARERGLRLEFANELVARSAVEIRLNGSIDRMTLDEALKSVLSTCRMSARITGNVLFVEPVLSND